MTTANNDKGAAGPTDGRMMNGYDGTVRYTAYYMGIDMAPIINAESEGWRESVYREIDGIVCNNFILNRIMDRDGNVLFDARDFLVNTANPIRAKHTRTEAITNPIERDMAGSDVRTVIDKAAIRAEMEPIYASMTKTVYRAICESNGVSE